MRIRHPYLSAYRARAVAGGPCECEHTSLTSMETSLVRTNDTSSLLARCITESAVKHMLISIHSRDITT
jgi:hypothetical protein